MSRYIDADELKKQDFQDYSPADVTLSDGTELHIRLDRIESICDSEILKKGVMI